MSYKISRIRVQNFRSIGDLTIEYKADELNIICGAKNVGKTNFLRALDLFFSLDKNKFIYEEDVSYHIVNGSRGAGNKVQITITFINENLPLDKIAIKSIFQKDPKEGNVLKLSGKKNKENITEEECRRIIKQFRLIYVPASNINLPKIITETFKDEILTGLDKRKKKGKKAYKIKY